MDCNSNLTYIKVNWGVVAEDNDYGVMGNKDNRTYSLREFGLTIFCVECGCFYERYSKWFYPEDKIIMSFDELEEAEMCEVEYCLNQFDQKKDFKPQYKWHELDELKKKLREYEIKYPIKEEKKKVKKKEAKDGTSKRGTKK